MKKPIIGVVAGVVILVCLVRLWPGGGRTITRDMVQSPRKCLKCGHTFDAPTGPLLVKCPKCGERQGARVHYYYCRKCGERIEAFVERPADPTLAKVDPIKPPEMVFRREGGEWVKSVKKLGTFTCPKCRSTNVGPKFP